MRSTAVGRTVSRTINAVYHPGTRVATIISSCVASVTHVIHSTFKNLGGFKMEKYHFIITRHCPLETIFDGEMTFTEARKFMDENATSERRVGFKVFNEYLNKWQDFRSSYHGNRKVYDENGDLWIIDEDYRNMWRAGNERISK